MLGNEIVVAAPEPRGIFLEGTIDDTSLPGTAMQITPAATFVGGEPHWQHYQPSADADPRLAAILLNDALQGQIYSTAYVVGARCFLYCPLPGEYINIAIAGQQGTGNANVFTIGERFIPNHSTGLFSVTTTSSQIAWFMAMEAYTPPADQTAWLWTQKQ